MPATTSPRAHTTAQPGALPDWFVTAMPHGYQTRLAEIRRLTEELEEMDRFGRVMLETGDRLTQTVAGLFSDLKYEVAPFNGADPSALVVKLDGKRRLLLCASQEIAPIGRKSADVARVFATVQDAEPTDRVVLVANVEPMTPPPSRADAVMPEALDVLQRLGVNIVTGPVLFSIWSFAVQEASRAQKCIDRLHTQDGGVYTLPNY